MKMGKNAIKPYQRSPNKDDINHAILLNGSTAFNLQYAESIFSEFS